MIDAYSFLDCSTQELRDFISDKISFINDAMVGFLTVVSKDRMSQIDHKLAIIVTAPIFTSTTGVYCFKYSVFDQTTNKPTDIEFTFHTGFVAGDGYYYFKTEILNYQHMFRMDQMLDKETVRKLISYHDEFEKEK